MNHCHHEWKTYVGLTESFEYCCKCDVKKTAENSLPDQQPDEGGQYSWFGVNSTSDIYAAPPIRGGLKDWRK